GHTLAPFKALFSRLEKKQIDAVVEETKALFAAANKAAEKTEAKPTALSTVEPIAETITIDDFAKLDMRVAKVLKCEA
ncbi:hypothetical protein, partial [Streptococcus pneumoniae]